MIRFGIVVAPPPPPRKAATKKTYEIAVKIRPEFMILIWFPFHSKNDIFNLYFCNFLFKNVYIYDVISLGLWGFLLKKTRF